MDSRRIDVFALHHELEDRLGIHFKDKSLLTRALTHRSFLNEAPLVHMDNERLEFLGDAVIDLLVAEVLYQRFPEQREGTLTTMRASLVRRETLARFARQIDLGKYLLLGRGEAENGGRERDALLCAAFEALCGAIYLDQGLETAASFLYPLLEPMLVPLAHGELTKDPKSRLQEWAQTALGETPHYVTVGSTGPDHAKEFTVEVWIGQDVYGVGVGLSKQKAAQQAARAALEAIAGRE
ncbi:MAG: ribonuclease III [Chloroflexi bacterium]|nr:ribonuclease III [Chloroflexota bacterium]